ncbi:TPA: hypothetical protein ACG50A_005583, partial [Escherichia coli]
HPVRIWGRKPRRRLIMVLSLQMPLVTITTAEALWKLPVLSVTSEVIAVISIQQVEHLHWVALRQPMDLRALNLLMVFL